ncbi:MAG: VWA domain-containing protein [Thermomonas sp.]
MNALLSDIAQLHFLRPWWLPGLLLLPAIAWWWRADALRRSLWQDHVDAHLLPHLLEGSIATSHRPWARWLGLLAAAVALLAMAGPSWQKVEQPLWQTKAPLVVALDLSSSILARDLPPSRLPQARAKLATLLRERAGGQVGLVAYAGDAYTVAPLTEDAANVALFLDALGPDVMPEDGQRAERAIAWSRNLLQQAGFAHGDILLLTDHADAAAVGAAAKARVAGYRVSALGLGTAHGGTFEAATGLGQARLDAASLGRLASSGGGGYQTLTVDAADLRALGVLDPQADTGAAVHGEKIASWRDGGFWLLPLAMLLVLPLFRRGAGVVAMLALVMLLPMRQARAQASPAPPTADRAVKAKDTNGLWRRRDQVDYARMQDAIDAYRKQEFDKAIEGFSGNPTADGQYNLGNALAKGGQLDAAIEAYDRALKLHPGMADALANRKLVDAARKRKPPPNGKSQQDQQKKSGQDKQQPGQGQQQDKQNQSGQDPTSGQKSEQPRKQDQQSSPPKPGQSPSNQEAPQPQDAKAQADADAAQRKRMLQALGKQAPAGKPGQRPGVKPETPEQREQRLANQAQLQRVPDDPGALLRARFRLQYERRQHSGSEP